MKRTITLVAGLLMAVAASADVISVLPAPVGTETIEGVEVNVYELGTLSVPTDSAMRITKANVPKLGYIDWGSLNVPIGSKIRFTGGIMLDTLPDGYIYDWSQVNYVWASSAGGFLPAGSTFAIPEQMIFRYLPLTLSFPGDGTYTAARPNQSTYRTPLRASVVNNGNWVTDNDFNNDSSRLFYAGDVSGNGTISYPYIGAFTFQGRFLFDGVVSLGKNSNYIAIMPTNNVSSLGTLSFSANDLSSNLQYVHYAPSLSSGETGTLTIENTVTIANGGGLDDTPGTSMRRHGRGFLVYGGNTIVIQNLHYNQTSGNGGPVHFVADSTFNGGAFDKGVGNVTINKIWANYNPVIICPSANINLTASSLHTGGDRAFKFDYTAESNRMNVCTLDLSSNIRADHTLTIKGFNPSLLPRTILLHANQKSKATLQVLDDEWTFPFDFTAAASEINPARCVADGVLDAPATGTIILDCVAGTPIPGEYPLMTCTAGAEELADWNVEFRGSWPGVTCTVVRDATGIRLQVKEIKGFMIIFQ